MTIERNISTFIKTQFPAFYQEEGPHFIAFVEAYYEWMELEGKPIHESRDLIGNANVDTTIDEFVDHYQATYLWGLPETVQVDRRFIVKHILDLYRAKGTPRGCQLLFRLIYNEDAEIYLPSKDMLRASDGTWIEPKYLEVTPTDDSLVGKYIIGSSTQAQAVVQSYARFPVNGKIIHVLFISDTTGDFAIGEKIVPVEDFDTAAVADAPKIIGSLTDIDISAGGQNFAVGEVLKVITDGEGGQDGEAVVTEVERGSGTMAFTIVDGGTLYSMNAVPVFTRSVRVGSGASFAVGSLTNVQEVSYNTDLILPYASDLISTKTSTILGNFLTFANATMGTIGSLTDIHSGDGYTAAMGVSMLDYYTVSSTGNVFFSNTSLTLTGNNTTFTSQFAAGNYIKLTADPGTNAKTDIRIITAVTNNTVMTLDDYPAYTSNGNILGVTITTPGSGYSNSDTVTVIGSGTGANVSFTTNDSGAIVQVNLNAAGHGYYTAPTFSITTSGGSGGVLAATVQHSGRYDIAVNPVAINFTADDYMPLANITASPLSGSGIISKVRIKSSGFGHRDGDQLVLKPYGAIANLTITDGGTGYANNARLVFAGGSAVRPAQGIVSTNSNGTITSATITYAGSAYKSTPTVSVIGAGTGAILDATVGGYNEQYNLTGQAILGGMGVDKGYWSTSRGFLSADKYIQDSYYYQEFSYEVRSAVTFDRYSEMLKKVFHVAGTELFGQTTVKGIDSMSMTAAYDSVTPNDNTESTTFLTASRFVEGSDTTYGATVTSTRPLTPTLVVSTGNIYFPFVLNRVANTTLTATLYNNGTDTFYSPIVAATRALTPSLFNDGTDTYYGPTITTNSTQALTASLVNDGTDTFYSATISNGSAAEENALVLSGEVLQLSGQNLILT